MRRLILLTTQLLVLFSAERVLAQRSAIDSLTRALRLAAQDTNRVFLLAALSRQYQYSRPDSAVFLAQEGYDLSQQLGFLKGESLCLNRMANPTQVLGNIPKALALFNKAYQISKASQDQAGMARSLNNMANLHAEQGDYTKAITYLHQAKHRNDPARDPELQLIILENLGDCYRLSNQLDSALHYAKWAYSVSDQLQNFILRGDIERILGDIELKKRNKQQALRYYQLSLASSKHVEDLQHMSQAYLSIATLYQMEHQPDSVIVFAKKALEQAQSGGFTRDILKAAGLLSDSYSAQRQPASAFYYFKISTAAKDSLFSQEKVKQLITLDFEERMKQQEIRVASKQYEDKIKIYSLLGGLFVLMLISVLVLRNNRQQQKANTLLQNQKAETEAALRDLRSMQAQLIQKEKLASLGELTAGIAHEIQNPLNFVNNFSEVSAELVDELKDELARGGMEEVGLIADDLTQNLQKIHHHGQRASHIVKGMLEHSRTGQGERQLTNLNALADEYLRLAYQGQRAKDKTFNCELVTIFDPEIGQVKVVPPEIGRVLLNLYNNAFYAVQAKAKIASTDYKPQIVVQTEKENIYVLIRVGDNGVGIAESVKAKIFQPFFTTKPTGEGTGLGLSLSYDIVTKGYGGSLEVESGGEGTQLVMRLPL